MSADIEVVIFGTLDNANNDIECVPLISENILLILLFLNPSSALFQSVFEEVQRRRDQPVRVIICSQSNDRFTNNSITVIHVSEWLLTYKIQSTILQFIEMTHKETSEAQRKKILEWFSAKKQLKRCHILLIPLNATRKNLHTVEQRFKIICHALHRDAEIRTIYDFIPEDDYDNLTLVEDEYLERYYNEDICEITKKYSFIRVFVVGNEQSIASEWSKRIVASVPNVDADKSFDYVGQYVFVRDESVIPRYTEDLVPIFSNGWKITFAIPKALDDIKQDINFQTELIYICEEFPSHKTNDEAALSQQSLTDSDPITTISSQMHFIQEAHNGPEEKQEAGRISSQILE